MLKKILFALLIVTVFANISFAFSVHCQTYEQLKNKNSIEGKFVRQIFNDIRKTPTAYKTGYGPYYKTDLVSAIEAVRLTTNCSWGIHNGVFSDAEAIELAQILVSEIKK